MSTLSTDPLWVNELPSLHDLHSDANNTGFMLDDEPRYEQDPDAFPLDEPLTPEEEERAYRDYLADQRRSEAQAYTVGSRVRVIADSDRMGVGSDRLAGKPGTVDSIFHRHGRAVYDVRMDHVWDSPMRCSFPFTAEEIEPEALVVVQGMAWVASLSDDTLIDSVEVVKANPSFPGIPAETREKFLVVAAAELSRRINERCGMPTAPAALLSAEEVAEITGTSAA